MKQFLFYGLALLVFGLAILLILEQGRKLQSSSLAVPNQSSSVASTDGIAGVEPSASLVENLRVNLQEPLTRLFIQFILIIVARTDPDRRRFAGRPMNFSAVILAGGKSSRMGRDNAWLQVDGQPLLARQIRLARELGAAEALLRSGCNAAAVFAGNCVQSGLARLVELPATGARQFANWNSSADLPCLT